MISSAWRRKVILNAKNMIGWTADRKIIVFSVDDYGNVRIDSPEARLKIDAAGFEARNRFDAYDTLETREDLEMLFEALCSVKDKNGRPAIFTCYAMPCNIDFEKMRETDYEQYYYETLPETFRKKADYDLENYNGAWGLWKTGIAEGFLIPQFHGREHFNIKVFTEKLAHRDKELLIQLKNRSLTTITNSGYSTISALAAFEFWDFNENEQFADIIRDGLDKFETVFGYRAQNFTPPAYSAHPVIYELLKNQGIQFVDTALVAKQHQGRGHYKKELNYTGKFQNGLRKIVRNVIFEPNTDLSIDWPSYAMQQIEAAFRWNRPAIISSHRVNFCGHIDENNRKKGVQALEELLNKIVTRWPEVEFMAANELGSLIKAA